MTVYMKTWKQNWEESKKRYVDWWEGRGLLISMWEHLEKEGTPHEPVPEPKPAENIRKFWLDPEWRAEYLHYTLSRSSFLADIPPVANTHLGPGSLAAILGAELDPGEDTIWIRQNPGPEKKLELDEDNPWWRLHLDLLRACKKNAAGKYFVGCPDLVEGLDVLASIRGTDRVMTDMLMQPEVLKEELAQVNRVYFEVFDRIYDVIQEEGEMAFCYFSLWGPGTVSKLQSDISVMISEEDFRHFALPYFDEQCRKIDFTLYHLDGVDAIRHLDAVLEIPQLNAVQWTPGYGEPQGGDPKWFGLYQRILEAGKSLMPCWVRVEELKSLLDNVGAEGLNILMDFKTEKDIEAALKTADEYR
jgi:hypothetical protein